MGDDRIILLILMVLGVLARNSLIVTSAGILIILQSSRLQLFFPILERRGTELGLTLLLIAVLVPFASGKVGWEELRRAFTSLPGFLGIVGGITAAVISGRGVALLEVQPEVIVGLVVGSIIGVILFKGIPVGPLAAAGFTAILLKLFGR